MAKVHPHASAAFALMLMGSLAAPLDARAPWQEEQEESEDPGPTVLFDSSDIVDITIETTLRTLIRDIDSTKFQEHDGVLTYTADDGSEVRLDVALRTRGHYRRQRRNCNFPPLRVNFKKGQVVGTLFANQDKLKLVVHCQNGRDEYEQYVLQEYLTYRTFSLLTEQSFRVRPLRITYIDTEGREDTMTKFAFFIEDEEELASRMEGEIVEIQGIHPMNTDLDFMGLVDVFQYMIGNTDWSVSGLHNIKIVESDFMYYAIPYDFDWTGMVNTRYARPDARLGIRRVTDRLFRGYCRSPENFQQLFEWFNARRDSIYALWQEFPHLEERRRERAIEYLDDFYEVINDERRVRREFHNKCAEG